MGLAVVSGASRGLGFESARGLGAAGFDLALVAKDADRLQEAAAKLGNEFPNIAIKTFPVDLADSEATRNVIAQIQSVGTVEILMLAHGVMSEKMAKTLRTTPEEWQRVMGINLDGTFNMISAIGPQMAQRKSGRIINVSACLGRFTGPGLAGGLAPYRISKTAVNALTKNLAAELGNGTRGVLVDAMCPNHTRTDMGGPDAPRTAAEGAETAIWLATRSFTPGVDQTGLLWEDREVVPW